MLKSTPAGVMSVPGAVVFACVWTMAACDRETASLQPSPIVTTGVTTEPPTLILFTDSATVFSTTDVHDAQDRIVRFNSAGELIWAADDTRYTSGRVIVGSWVEPLSTFLVNGNYVGRSACLTSTTCTPLVVRFGSINGERRAYLTLNPSWFHAGSMMTNIEVADGSVVITATSMPVPGSTS
jgi:hypothetical protein